MLLFVAAAVHALALGACVEGVVIFRDGQVGDGGWLTVVGSKKAIVSPGWGYFEGPGSACDHSVGVMAERRLVLLQTGPRSDRCMPILSFPRR